MKKISFMKSKKYVIYVKKNEMKKINLNYIRKLEIIVIICHYTGKVREAAHSICNLRYKVQNKIPVIIHNGSKYDYHFITKSLKGIFSA